MKWRLGPSILNLILMCAYSSWLVFCPTKHLLAQSVAPGESYLQVEVENYRYVYSADWRPLLPAVIEFNRNLNRHYEESFGFKLDEMTTLVLASRRNQETNGFATQYPFSLTVFYQGGSDAYDDFANSSWWKTLLIHEVAHLYQLNAKRELSKFADRVFGNEIVTFIPLPFMPLPFIPVLNTPNMLLPTWLIEGNAVFNESRFGLGGRLYSGQSINLVYSLIQQKEVDEVRLTNNVLDFPFTREKYLLGGILNAELAQKYGTEKTNSYFLQQAYHYFNPFRLDMTYEDYYGEGYSAFVDRQLQALKEKSIGNSGAQASPIKGISANHVAHFGLHREGKRIILSTRKDIYSPITLATITEDGEVQSRSTFHLGGKAFLFKGRLYTSAVGKTTDRSQLFSFWGEREERLTEFDGLQVFDWNGSIFLAADVTKSHDGMSLVVFGADFKTNENLKAHSSGLLDEAARPIYFVQLGEERRLMRGQEKLFSFQGHYGYPVDIVGENIFFVAATEFGSGLFLWQKGKCYRLTRSDRIVNARVMGKGKLFLVEQDAFGYQYGVVESFEKSLKEEIPWIQKWTFEKQDHVAKAPSMDSVELKEENYGSLADLRFSSWRLGTAFSMDKTRSGEDKRVYDWSTGISFYDPIQYYGLSLSALNQESNGEKEGNLTFLLNRYLWQWQFFYEYEDFKSNPFTDRLGASTSHEFGVYADYLISRYRQWEYWLDLGYSHLIAQNQKPGKKSNWAKTYAGFTAKRNLGTSLSMFPFVRDLHQFETLADRAGETIAWHSLWGRRIFEKSYIDLAIDGYYTDRGQIHFHENLKEEKAQLPLRALNALTPLGNWSFSSRLGGGIKTILDVHAYHRWIPIGIHQFAPGLVVNLIDYKNQQDLRQRAIEYGVSGDVNFLLGHIASVQGQIYLGRRKASMQEGDAFIQFTLGETF